MTSPTRWRMTDGASRIAVTGAAGYVGALLVRRLERDSSVERVLAVDVRPPKRPFGPRVTFLQQSVLSPLAEAFKAHDIHAVAHLAYLVKAGHNRNGARAVNVDGTAGVLQACERAKVGRVVYLSSTSVYGAHRDNPNAIAEEIEPRPLLGFSYSQDKLASEKLIESFGVRASAEVTILRACPVLGASADNAIAGAFLKPILLGVRGHDPPLQLLHEDDAAGVLARCLLNPAPGLYNVAGEGIVRWSKLARLLGRPLLKLPAPLAYAVAAATWALRLQSDSPASGLSFVRYPWTASTEKVRRELGVTFEHTSLQACRDFAEAVIGRA